MKGRLSITGSLGSVAVALCGLALWAAVTRFGWVSPIFLPHPFAAAAALWEGLSQGDWGTLMVATTERMVYGWALASLIGMAIGAVIGISPTLRAWLQPTLEVIRPLPASAVIPVAIALFGLTPGMVLGVVAFGAMWPVLLATVQGFASVDKRLHEVSRLLGLSRTAFVFKIGLPNALPDALSGMRLSLTVALILSIVGEMLASQDGLGTALIQAARSYRSAELFGGVMLLGVIGFVSNALLGSLQTRLLRWQER